MNGSTDGQGALERLRAAGVNVAVFNDAQRALLAALSEDELAVLLEIQERVGELSDDVEGHNGTMGGLMF
jgi:hypothetical protein